MIIVITIVILRTTKAIIVMDIIIMMIRAIKIITIIPRHTKFGTVQRRLPLPLRRDDTQIREALQNFFHSRASLACERWWDSTSSACVTSYSASHI